jgi:hypothetical protein
MNSDRKTNAERNAEYHSDPYRVSKIFETMTQAFGAQGRTLTDSQAEQILPGWLESFRSIPTQELERVRTEGLELGCRNAQEFLTRYLARVQAEAFEELHRRQTKRFRSERENAVPAGVLTPGKQAALEAFKERGWL